MRRDLVAVLSFLGCPLAPCVAYIPACIKSGGVIEVNNSPRTSSPRTRLCLANGEETGEKHDSVEAVDATLGHTHNDAEDIPIEAPDVVGLKERDVPVWVMPDDAPLGLYRADNRGNVYSVRTRKKDDLVIRRKLKPHSCQPGDSARYILSFKGRHTRVSTQRIMMATFEVPYPDGQLPNEDGKGKWTWQIVNNNGDLSDNRLSNLSYTKTARRSSRGTPRRTRRAGPDLTDVVDSFSWRVHPDHPEIEVAMEGAIRYSDRNGGERKKYLIPAMTNKGFAQAQWVDPTSGKNKSIMMHKVVYRTWGRWVPEYASSYWRVRHINGNKMDNHLVNLEVVSCEETYRIPKPEQKLNPRNKSGVSSVNWASSQKAWSAFGMKGGKQIHLGYFNDITTAEKVLNEFKSFERFRHLKALEQSRDPDVVSKGSRTDFKGKNSAEYSREDFMRFKELCESQDIDLASYGLLDSNGEQGGF
ncbi:unnamed protein product [Choristocarpus tenellus]